MAPRTWHILREDGTTVDITTKMQLADALSTAADDEFGHAESDLPPIVEIRCLVCASKGGECSWHPFYNSECSCCATTPDYHGPDFWQSNS